MLVRKCDRCGKEILDNFWYLRISYISHDNTSENNGKQYELELCEECIEKEKEKINGKHLSED